MPSMALEDDLITASKHGVHATITVSGGGIHVSVDRADFALSSYPCSMKPIQLLNCIQASFNQARASINQEALTKKAAEEAAKEQEKHMALEKKTTTKK